LKFQHNLTAGDIISNAKLTQIFQCSTQGGMRRSHQTNSLVIISNHTTAIYEDRWVSDTLYYTGMGLEGNQSLNHSQNKTLNESSTNGVTPYLFEVYEPRQYLFRGQVELVDHPFSETQPDINNQERIVWVFPLKLVEAGDGFNVPAHLVAKKQQRKEKQARRLSDEELKKRVTNSRKQPSNRQVTTTTYERNVYVAELAKRRANGVCQLCKSPAPFSNKKNEPYLEAHHVVWLSKGGDDTIGNSVALCPNCHRRMHVLNLKSDRKKLEREANGDYSD
jgi:5-methylcytosine-specific restriction protein A